MLEPLSIRAKFQYLKMLRLNVVGKIIDVLQAQALEEKKEIFNSLKKKLSE